MIYVANKIGKPGHIQVICVTRSEPVGHWVIPVDSIDQVSTLTYNNSCNYTDYTNFSLNLNLCITA